MQEITRNADGTFSWATPEGHAVTSCVPPYEETFFDRTLVGYVMISYSLWARTILREFWKSHRTTEPPKWMQQAKPQRVALEQEQS